ncbi:MAG: hypothetical protein EOL97_15620 [Spirochaetia bacterium]|nr:hypothetical protein [Spirochaetia bacterium]
MQEKAQLASFLFRFSLDSTCYSNRGEMKINGDLLYYNKFVIINLVLIITMTSIKYYENNRGDNEILKFINNLETDKYKLAIIYHLDKLEREGISKLLQTHDVSKINQKPDVYKLRAHYGKMLFRLLFGLSGGSYYMVVIFCKKNKKIGRKYIDLAIKRIKEYESSRI